MKRPSHIFFDLDHTLWDFERNASETIAELLGEYCDHIGESLDADLFYCEYSTINRQLWDAFESKQIGREALRADRWPMAFGKFGVGVGEWIHDFSHQYSVRCPCKPHLMPGAHELLQSLHGRYTLAIITNGFLENQTVKLKVSGMAPYFCDMVTSDMAGTAKPDPKIFAFALDRLGAEAHNSFYIGDTYGTDILGAQAAGFSVVYFNPDGKPNPVGVPEVRSLPEMISLFA